MIGVALIEECVRQGIEVYAVIRENTEKRFRLPESSQVHPVTCSLENMEKLPELISEQCDTFFHIAWGNTGANRNKSAVLQSKNIEYTLEAVQAAKKLGCTRFIGAGSQAEYGPQEKEKIGPDTAEHPITPYGVSKLAAGKLSRLLCEELGMEWIWCRIFSVYGIYDKESTMVMTALHQFMKGQETIFTPAQQQWDYLYSKDAGRAFYLVGEKGISGSVYCVGSGKAQRLKEYICRIRDATDSKAEPGIGKKPYPPHPVMHLCADIDSLTRDTGFVPQYKFSEGIEEMVQWLREKNK